jgi:hypothetical protein
VPRHESETEDYLVIVGWDDGLQTYFGQVWRFPEGDDTDDPPELWVGTSWEEVPTPGVLNGELTNYATIPEDLMDELAKDYQRSSTVG